MENSTIDHEKKRLHDSISIIANQDNYTLLFGLMRELHQRQQLCQTVVTGNVDKELLVEQLKYHNERIKKLLML